MSGPSRCVCGIRFSSTKDHRAHGRTCAPERARASAFIVATSSGDWEPYFSAYPENVR